MIVSVGRGLPRIYCLLVGRRIAVHGPETPDVGEEEEGRGVKERGGG